MTVSLASLHFRRPARPARPGPVASHADAPPAAPAWRARRPRADYAFVALTPLDTLLDGDAPATDSVASPGKRGAAAEGRGARFVAARTLVVGGVLAGLLVAGALTGIVAMATDIVRSISEA